MEINMKNIKNMLVLAGCVAALGLSSGKLAAQGRGNFDPAQFKERAVTRVIEQMNITDDSEKKAISDALGKVFDARMEVGLGGGRGFGGGGRRNRGNNTDTNSASADTSTPRRGGGGRFGALSPEADDLQKAIDAKAPADEIEAKLAKLRESNLAKQAKLEAAQADLQKLLTSRQEAVAVLNGMLK